MAAKRPEGVAKASLSEGGVAEGDGGSFVIVRNSAGRSSFIDTILASDFYSNIRFSKRSRDVIIIQA